MAALRSPLALIYGVVSTLFLAPLLAIPILRLPIHPPEMALGLAVFCCVPTTCVTLTNVCRGNAAVALLLVVATSVLGVFTIPTILGFILGSGAGAVATFDPAALFRSLVSTVLIPLLIGIALQASVPGLPAWRTRNRKLLSYASTFCLCMVPWMQLSLASRSNLPLTPAAVATAAAAGAGLHLVLLGFNTLVVRSLRFSTNPSDDTAIRKAVILVTSEKTLPVAVAVLGSMTSIGAAVGLAVVPCVLAHMIQIAIDSAMVSRWNKREAAAAVMAAA